MSPAKVELNAREAKTVLRALDEAADAAYHEELANCKPGTRTPLKGKVGTAEAAMKRQHEYIVMRDEIRRRTEAPAMMKRKGKKGLEDLV